MIMNKKRYLYSAFLLTPTAAFANGVSPILNLFHKETWIPTSIVTLVIILLESCLLRWRIKGSHFASTLWKCLLFNIASSITGSLILIVTSRDSFFIWDSMSLVFPLFLITLCTEIPLLYVLFKDVPLTGKRAIVLGCGINAASYIAVFILQIGLFMGWTSHAKRLDKKEIEQWNNPKILEHASGRIYKTGFANSESKLSVYNLQNSKWDRLPNCPTIDYDKWDIEGNMCVFLPQSDEPQTNKNLFVSHIPSFKTIIKIPLGQFSDKQFDNWQGAIGVALSPDKKKLAILYRLTGAVAPKNSSGYFNLGDKCRLIIIDVLTGKEISRASRWASDYGLCWLADSDRILFSSYDDESLYQTKKDEVDGSTSYGVGYESEGKFKMGLYLFNIREDTISRFADGYNPSRSATTDLILVQGQGKLVLLDSTGKKQTKISNLRIGYSGAVISPSGDIIIAEFPIHAPFRPTCNLVAFNIKAPDVRHILSNSWRCRLDWTIDTNETQNSIVKKDQ